jgi:hypothetical protein
MTTRAGWTYNGKHFAETWFTQGRSPVLRCSIDGKPVARKIWKALLAEAKAADEAKANKENISQ